LCVLAIRDWETVCKHLHTVVCRCNPSTHEEFNSEATAHGFHVFSVSGQNGKGATIDARVAVQDAYRKANKIDANSMHVQFFLRNVCTASEVLFIAYALASCYERDYAFRLFQHLLEHVVAFDDPRRFMVGRALMQQLIQPLETTDMCTPFGIVAPVPAVSDNVHSFIVRRGYLEPMRPATSLADFNTEFGVYINAFDRRAMQIIGKQLTLRTTVINPIEEALLQCARHLSRVVKHPHVMTSATSHALLSVPDKDNEDALRMLQIARDVVMAAQGMQVDFDKNEWGIAKQPFKDAVSGVDAVSTAIKRNHVVDIQVTADEELKLFNATNSLFATKDSSVNAQKTDEHVLRELVYKLKCVLMSCRATEATANANNSRYHRSMATLVVSLLKAWQTRMWPWITRPIAQMRAFRVNDEDLEDHIESYVVQMHELIRRRNIGNNIFRAAPNNPLAGGGNVGAASGEPVRQLVPGVNRGGGMMRLPAEQTNPVGHS